LVESIHRVSAVVVDADNRLVAAAGDAALVTFWRSAAKPFQSLPLVQDGVAERFGLDDEDLALACASHSSEPFHLAAVDRFLAKVGVPETALACGPHPPLSAEVADRVLREGLTLTPRWSNCSGKHTGMLALAKHHGWPLAGYERAGHPVQNRILGEVERWTGVGRDGLEQAVDGCTTVCFGLPLRAMALAYARFGTSSDAGPRRLWRATTTHPHLVAGTKRVCTEVMRAWPGEIFAKIGAEGVYSAAIPSLELGIAIKVEDGDMRSAGVVLLAVVRQLLALRGQPAALEALDRLPESAQAPIHTTRGEVAGQFRAAGRLELF
jgi:L-asparaginase II